MGRPRGRPRRAGGQGAGRRVRPDHPVELDITNADHVAALRDLPGLDALVNNAGIAVGGPIETIKPDDVRHQFEVNVVGQIAVTQAVLPQLRAARGRIAFISSLNGRVSIPLSGCYNASKFALEALADALRVELRPWRIGVTLVEPGCHDTDPWRGMMDLLDELTAAMTPEHRELYARHTAGQRALLGKLLKQVKPPERVAAAVEKVLTARRPPARVLVGPDARALVGMRRALPTRVLDRFWARGSAYRKNTGSAS
ncbi:SDR family NAD(P)-dependent oxidoreductase [Actinokineospora soli]|uniref:SDR family NAD(P)-dependent oxidoreductase n=1 Tax=Actinokineospora soli TaxID=1048753 RepID=A0ABW2TWA4_9PSEU